MSEITHTALHILLLLTLIGLCLTGIVLSCLSISGTWLVAVATALAAVSRADGGPGWWTVLVFVVISTAVEAAEALAGAWGVARRGGSRLAGVAAVCGGLLGLAIGSVVVPVVGSLLGMVVGSFALVFLVEIRRLKRADQAAGIAWGAVVARLLIVVLKVAATLVMSAYLFIAIWS